MLPIIPPPHIFQKAPRKRLKDSMTALEFRQLARESDIHSTYASLMNLRLPMVLHKHTPNEGKRSIATWKFLEKLGVLPGWPDHDHFYCRFSWFVELKRPGEKPKPHQLKLHKRIRAQGFPVGVFEDPEEAFQFSLKQVERINRNEALFE